MNPIPMRAVLLLAAALAAGMPARAQQREPHAGYIFPAGGRQGTTVQVVLGGQYLDGAVALNVQGGGVQAVVTRHYKTLTPQQLNGIRNNYERMQALEEAGRTDPAKKKEAEAIRARIDETLRSAGIDGFNMRAIAEYRKKMSDPKRQANPAISETVHLNLAIAADATPGTREIRLRTEAGLTNPLRFQIGRLPEYTEQEPNDRTPDTPIALPLPMVINGQVMPGDLDRFRFTAKKGDRLVASAAARSLIPYLADAVPGWFQATLGLYDIRGKELAYDDDNRFDPDPVVYCEIPADGDYYLEIKDSIFRGREDFVYRITLGEVPFLTGIFPLGGPAGDPVSVAVSGWNLPARKITIGAGIAKPGLHRVGDDADDRLSNRLPFQTDTLPECLETEPNDDVRAAARIELPAMINGRMDRPGDADLFRFQARKGEPVVAEVLARRLNSPMDSVLRILDVGGKQVAINDDFDDKGAGLVTHQADSRIEFTPPADGAYILEIADTQGKGGPSYAYRCRLSAPRPDFELRVVPSSINARAGLTIPIAVYALRKDGYDGPIAIALKDAPPGFELSGGGIPAGQEKVRLTLRMPSEPTERAVRLQMTGSGTVAGKQVVREAVPADDMMQAFFYRHLVPAEALLATVYGRGFRAGPGARVLSDLPVRIPAGGVAQVRLATPMSSKSGPKGGGTVQFDLNEPPEGIAVGRIDIGDGATTVEFSADGDKAKAGLRGNLIVEAFIERQFTGGGTNNAAKNAPKQRYSIGVLPAIPFEVVARKP